MIWIGLPLFLIAGIVVLIMRKKVAWGISVFMGASANVGCAIAFGIFLILIAAAFVALDQAGILK